MPADAGRTIPQCAFEAADAVADIAGGSLGGGTEDRSDGMAAVSGKPVLRAARAGSGPAGRWPPIGRDVCDRFGLRRGAGFPRSGCGGRAVGPETRPRIRSCRPEPGGFQ